VYATGWLEVATRRGRLASLPPLHRRGRNDVLTWVDSEHVSASCVTTELGAVCGTTVTSRSGVTRMHLEVLMRMMLKAQLDTVAASDSIDSGRMPEAMQQAMKQLQPEAAYFGPDGGKRTAFVVFDMKDPSQLPAISEPLYREFHATIEIFPVMNRDDLERGLSQLGG
jgi:hypothetical protein